MTDLEKEIRDKLIKVWHLDNDLYGKQDIVFDENTLFFTPNGVKTEMVDKPCLGMDSIEWLEMSFMIEDEYGVHFTIKEVENFNSVKEIADFLISKGYKQ